MDEKDISIVLKDDMIILSAERLHGHERKQAGYHRLERVYESVRRMFVVPANADRDNIKASLRNKVLCTTMPRNGVVAGNMRTIAVESATAD